MRMRILLLCAAVMMSFVIPLTTNAAQTCSCFCGNEAEGAFKVGSSFTDTNECLKVCKDFDDEAIGCFTNEADWPIKSNKCWTEEQCTGGIQEGKGNTWDDDIAACVHEPIKMGYCYLAPRTLTTIIAISGDNTFASLADYINALYKYLVPVMSIVAIIMVMVAGLQYILSRGNPSAVKQAKERIVQAVVGIILLLSAYTLARLLDPSLVNLEQLRVPMVKEVVLLDEGSKCETLALAGIEIDSVAGASFVDKTCSYEKGAVQGIVTDMANVDPNVSIGQWKEGDKCDYSKCSQGSTCMSTGCVECASVAIKGAWTEDATKWSATVNVPFTDLTPSTNNCDLMSDTDNLCMYTAGGDTLLANFLPSCVSVPIECNKLKSDVKAGTDSCALYGSKIKEKQSYWPWPNIVGKNVLQEFTMEEYAKVDPSIYETVCNSDPCELGAIGGMSCTFVATSDGGRCESQ